MSYQNFLSMSNFSPPLQKLLVSVKRNDGKKRKKALLQNQKIPKLKHIVKEQSESYTPIIFIFFK